MKRLKLHTMVEGYYEKILKKLSKSDSSVREAKIRIDTGKILCSKDVIQAIRNINKKYKLEKELK